MMRIFDGWPIAAFVLLMPFSMPASTVLSGPPGPVRAGRPVTVTLSVPRADNETVTFRVDGVFAGTALALHGQASLTSILPAGSHTVKASTARATASLPVIVTAAQPAEEFRLSQTLGARIGKGRAVVADFNNDGKADVAIGAMVFLGNGDGTFSAGIPVAGDVWASADFNRDGFADLATTSGILLGNGDGTFQPSPSLAGVDAAILVTGDFNGDGTPDLAATFASGELRFWLGNGDGTFEEKPVFRPVAATRMIAADRAVILMEGDSLVAIDGDRTDTISLAGASDMAAGDLNGDGLADLVVTEADGHVAVLLGQSGGGFAPATQYASSPGESPLIADVNGDGLPDVVIAGKQAGKQLWAFYGKGDGTLAAPVSLASLDGAGDPRIAAADFNADGRVDLAVASCCSDAAVHLGVHPDASGPSLPGGKLPFATVGVAYSFTFTATGGTPPYTYEVSTGVAGLSQSAGTSGAGNGLSGTPTVAENEIPVIVIVTDKNGNVGVGTYLLSVYNALAIATASLPNAMVGHAYSTTLAASGGLAPYTWAFVGTANPQFSLSLAANGTLSGTPNPVFVGTYPAPFEVTDTNGSTANRTLSLTIAPPPFAIATPSPLPSATAGVFYTVTLQASGALSAPTWAVSFAPPGLNIDAVTGVLSGTPTTPGMYSFPVTATETGAAANGTFTLNVAAGATQSQTITFPALPPYEPAVQDTTLQATASLGLAVSYSSTGSCSVVSGFLNFMSTGTCTVTASQAGNSQFTAAVPVSRTTVSYNPQVSPGNTLTLTSPGSASAKVTLTDGAGQAIPFSVVSPPSFLTVSPSSGTTPATVTISIAPDVSPGNYSGTVSFAPPSGSFGGWTVPVTAAVQAATKQSQTVTFSVAPPTEIPVGSGFGMVAIASSQLAVTYASSNTAICTVNGTSGLGTGISPGSCTITATQAGNQTWLAASATATINVVGPVTFATSTLPSGTVGTPYSAILLALGGVRTGVYSYSVVSGALPAGLSFFPNGGIAGTPTTAGSSSFEVQVTDGFNNSASQSFTIDINAAGSPTLSVSPNAITLNATVSGAAASQTVTVTYSTPTSGGAPTLTASADASFLSAPASVSLAGGTNNGNGVTTYTAAVTITANPGTLTGTQTGTVTFMVNGVSAPVTVTLNVAPVAIGLAPSSLVFTYTVGGAQPAPQSATAGTTPSGLTIRATALTTDGANWLAVSSGPATTPATLSVSMGPALATLSPGLYTGSITVSGAGTGTASLPVTLTVTAAGGPGIGPSISPSGVVPLFSTSPVIQPGNFTSIYGNNLAPSVATWNGDFPTTLNGVSVTIDGKPAYMVYVSPTQVNVQAPDDTTQGPVTVILTTAAGSTTSTVTLSPESPSFSLLDSRHVAAIAFNPDGSYSIVGPTGAFSYPTRPVAAGEVLVLYGVGFGPTMDQVPAGQPYNSSTPLAAPIPVTIGGQPAQVAFAGLVAAGLYQLNVTVPAGLASGDQPVVATVGPLSTGNGPVVTIQ